MTSGVGFSMRHRLLFPVEAFVACANAVSFVLTLVRRDWIEAVTGLDPDAGSGALEWALTAGLLAVALTFGLLARREWRRFAVSG